MMARFIEFKQAEKMASPQEKIACFADVLSIITSSIETFSSVKKPGAEDIFPIMVYLLVKAAPEQVYTTIKYMKKIESLVTSKAIDAPMI